MSIQTNYKDLNEFLAKHSTRLVDKNEQNKIPITHTRIPDKNLNVYAGSYYIPNEELDIFYKLYTSHIFDNKGKEYLTEKQLEENGPMAIDIDFRFNPDVVERIYTSEHVEDLVNCYSECLKEFYIFEPDKPFSIYVFEKPNVNRLPDGSLTKDGIHILFGLQVDHIIQCMLREKAMTMIKPLWEDMPFINSIDSVFDSGISKGTTNWQLFGSRKPGCEAYELKYHYTMSFDPSDGNFIVEKLDVRNFDIKNNFAKLSVRYDKNPKFELNPNILTEYNNLKYNKTNKPKKTCLKFITTNDNNNENENCNVYNIDIYEIVNEETLNSAIANLLKSLKQNEQEILEAHEFAQALPPKYYEPGSHLLNRMVAFALKHTDERLFISWVKLRSKASDFDYGEIPKLFNEWNKFSKSNCNGKTVTKRSLMFWLKKEDIDAYNKIKNKTIDHYINLASLTQTEYDIAVVLHEMYKSEYICTNLDKRGTWFKFQNHRWHKDKGLSLRDKISTDLYNKFSSVSDVYEKESEEYEEGDERKEALKKRITNLNTIKLSLKKTVSKDHIMREAAEIFYDSNFEKLMDANKYLMCFNNGVVDFKNKIFRDGLPEDYITKSTLIDYIQPNENNQFWIEGTNVINEFLDKIFPISDLRQYMFDHLASCLIGDNINQTFHVYHGSGSNGKSLLTELMGATLGEYKGTVPITLVTDNRGKIGAHSDEIIKLKGVRLAVMQEPTKGAKLNEGIMKELSGGDPIQARGIWCESEVFEPQWSLVVGTNNLFDIQSNDDGTWRRLRRCPFPSKFIEPGELFNDDTPYVFIKDKTLGVKLKMFAPVFAGMLVNRAFETEGHLTECETVRIASSQYRSGQDHISAFVNDKIRKTGNPSHSIKKKSLIEEFKIWFQQEQGSKKMPKSEEIYECINKKFKITPHATKGWVGLEFVREEDEEEDIIDNL